MVTIKGGGELLLKVLIFRGEGHRIGGDNGGTVDIFVIGPSAESLKLVVKDDIKAKFDILSGDLLAIVELCPAPDSKREGAAVGRRLDLLRQTWLPFVGLLIPLHQIIHHIALHTRRRRISTGNGIECRRLGRNAEVERPSLWRLRIP